MLVLVLVVLLDSTECHRCWFSLETYFSQNSPSLLPLLSWLLLVVGSGIREVLALMMLSLYIVVLYILNKLVQIIQ